MVCSSTDSEEADNVSLEYFDVNTNVKLMHVHRKNVDYVNFEKHLSDLHYSGIYSLNVNLII